MKFNTVLLASVFAIAANANAAEQEFPVARNLALVFEEIFQDAQDAQPDVQQNVQQNLPVGFVHQPLNLDDAFMDLGLEEEQQNDDNNDNDQPFVPAVSPINFGFITPDNQIMHDEEHNSPMEDDVVEVPNFDVLHIDN